MVVVVIVAVVVVTHDLQEVGCEGTDWIDLA